MMRWSDDPYSDADRYDDMIDVATGKLPRCARCGITIDDDFCYHIGEILCDECVDRLYRRRVTDLDY